jgi:hypothetical protein
VAQPNAGIDCPACGQLQAQAETCTNDKCKADTRKVKSPLHGLRFHDLRHYAVTELAESLASDQTIMAIEGHVSPRMLAHYSHVRLDAKRQALDAISNKGLRGSYGTNNITNSQTERVPFSRVIRKKMAGTTRLELATSAVTVLFRQKHRATLSEHERHETRVFMRIWRRCDVFG